MAKKPNNFKALYIRVLTDGPTKPADYPAALELINDGYAKGSAVIGHGIEDYGTIKHIQWNGVTTKGRIFADTLQNELDSSSLRTKATKFLLLALGFIAGALVQFGAAYIGRS